MLMGSGGMREGRLLRVGLGQAVEGRVVRVEAVEDGACQGCSGQLHGREVERLG